MTTLTDNDLSWTLRKVPAVLKKAMQSFPGKIYVAGGFIRSSIANEPINDVDVFVDSVSAAHALKRELSKGRDSRDKVVETDNAITLTGFKPAIQIIHRWTFTHAKVLVESFDFTCCRAAIWCDSAKGWHSLADDRFYPDLAAKRLVYCAPVRDEDAGGSALRVLKYYQKGYRIPLDSFAKVIARLVAGAAGVESVILSRLREVDPSVDPTHAAHLPSDLSSEFPSDLLAPAEAVRNSGGSDLQGGNHSKITGVQ